MRTPISCRFFAQAALLVIASTAVYAQTPLVPRPERREERLVLPVLPGTARWSVAVAPTTTVPPVMSERQVFAVLPPGVVAAFSVADGTEMWRVDLTPDHPIVVAGDHVFVAGGEAIHALRADTGAVAWRQPSGTLSAPLVVQDGWVIAAAANEVTARRASDGTVVWKEAAGGEQRLRASIEGETLYLPLTDGQVRALDVATGKLKWRRRLRGAASEILPLPERVYVGSDDRNFYCLDAETGETRWTRRVGAALIGRPAIDADHVYFVAMDNNLRAIERRNGAERWNAGLPFRPTAGPQRFGSVVVVPGPAAELQTFDARRGRAVAMVPFGERLASPPTFRDTEKGPIAVAVTGGLSAEWKLSLMEPSMAIPIAPLSVLPGQPVKWPVTIVAHARRARPLPAAGLLP